jgi:predicted ATPase
MTVRLSRLLEDVNIGLPVLEEILSALDVKDFDLSLNAKLGEDVVNCVLNLCKKDLDIRQLIEDKAKLDNKHSSEFPLKIVGKIDLDEYNKYRYTKGADLSLKNSSDVIGNSVSQKSSIYKESNKSFWIEDLIVLSSSETATRISVGLFDSLSCVPLYSVLIGKNGVGKSSMMKEIVDFFVDLHACQNESIPKLSSANNTRLKGIKYHIDGACCEVIRYGKKYLARINGEMRILNDLHLPNIVACHFGAFDKFPVQKVNGTPQTRYDVKCYKYVGAHVNGNMISSSAIIFRLLFALNENMSESQRRNICSILDVVGYDHRISLQYSFVIRSKAVGGVRNTIMQRVRRDSAYSHSSQQEIDCLVSHLYDFYKGKTSSTRTKPCYEIDFDSRYEGSITELKYIYMLRQCDLVNSHNVIFYKQGSEITSDEMSSGEFAMLSTVLSISAAAGDSHTLVLLDEPEMSLHPNWQMTLIDNLDRALKDKSCHLLIATHSHMLVSDLPMNRSCVTQLDKNAEGGLCATPITECTYGWSAEEVLLKVFKTATDRNRYFGERIGKLLEQMGNNAIRPEDVAGELRELQEISEHLSDVDPMKMILKTIVEAYN